MPAAVFEHYLKGQAAAIVRRRAAAEAEKRRREALDERHEEEARALFEETLRATPGISRESATVVQVPTGIARSVPIPPERVAAYRQHLEDTVAKAAALDSAEASTTDRDLQHRDALEKTEALFAAKPAIARLSARLCATCKGGCCTLAGNVAYLSPLTLRRFMDANPELDTAGVVQAYLDKLGDHSQEGTCINQTRSGCALPVEMRSDTCNAFFCSELKEFQKRAAADGNVRDVVAVQRAWPLWRRGNVEHDSSVTGVHVLKEE
ncbi:MAG: hypothetical protein AAFN78_08125 [Pseudomonadota bacterium]